MSEDSANIPVAQQRVVVTDVDISLYNMIWLLVKLALAAIPAAGIIFLVVVIAAAVIKAL